MALGPKLQRLVSALGYKGKVPSEEQDELARAAAAAAMGIEVPADLIKNTPSRTLHCDGREFRRLRSLARSGRPLSLCCLPVLSPLCLFYRIWLAVTNLTDLTYTAFVVSLSIAFNQVGGFGDGWLDVLDFMGSVVYFADILLGFHTGVVARWDTRAVVVRDGRQAALFYMWHGTFVVDFFASLPALAQIAIRVSGTDTHKLRLLYLLRLLRLLRVIRLLKNITPGSGADTSQPLMSLLNTRNLLLFNALFSLAVLVNLMGCIWWNIAVNEGLDNSWVVLVTNGKGIDLATSSDPTRWLVSCYFALTTVATIGYGDITPYTTSEVAVTMIFELIGVAFFGYIISTATSILSASGPSARRNAAVREKLEDAEEVMQQLALPRTLRRKIRTFYADQWVPPDDAAHDLRFQLYRELPPRIRVRMVQERQAWALSELGFFPPDLPPREKKQVRHILAAASVPVRMAAGETLSQAKPLVPLGDAGQQGLPGARLFILQEGEMRALRPGEAAPHEQRSYLGLRVDFCGPAIIGLTALFAASGDLLPEQDEGESGGHAPDVVTDAAGAPCGADADTASRSTDGSASGDDGSDDGKGGEEWQRGSGSGLGTTWQQDAVALTECHLWRISCAQVTEQLRQRHPAVLAHLLDKLLQTLGVRLEPLPPISSNGGSSGEPGSGPNRSSSSSTGVAAPPSGPGGVGGIAAATAGTQPTHGRQPSFRSAAVARLLQLREELAHAAAAAAAQRALAQRQSRTSVATTTDVSKLSSWFGRSAHQTSLELSRVTVASDAGAAGGVVAVPGSAGDVPDVWHVDSTR
ncbi:hypothetical protein ABPG77_010294 [Micractinium sp. CCAP 211/92]